MSHLPLNCPKCGKHVSCAGPCSDCLTSITDQELIKLVAEKIMGWTWISPYTENVGEWGVYHQFSGKYKTSEGLEINYIWDPITNANHWMMVVDRMQELDYEVRIHLFPKGKPHVHISNLMLSKKYPYRSGDIKDKPIGRAVCLAALSAVEGGT